VELEHRAVTNNPLVEGVVWDCSRSRFFLELVEQVITNTKNL
jgi:hypothetical protein